MRNLLINQTKFFYLNYKGEEKEVDSEGKYTGENRVIYSKANMLMGHISSAKGTSQVEIIGTDIDYDKSILITQKEFKKTGIDENSVFFIDKKVVFENETPLYNYRVVRIAETINEVIIAVKKVGK